MSVRRHSNRSGLAALALCSALAAGCAWLPEPADPTADWTASRFLSEAKDAVEAADYEEAISLYNKLQARYPFGRHAQQAQLESIYAHYRAEDAEATIAEADRFIRTNPRHPYVDYAYYMKGMANFTHGQGALERVLPSDPTRTDSAAATQSFNDFAELVRRFPESKYAEDARQRMVYLHNNIAAHEVNVADFYLRKGQHVAAANRAKFVLENHARSPAVPDALAIMTRAYAALGMTELARDALRVLRLNQPEDPRLAELDALVEGRPAPSRSLNLFGIGS